MNTEQLVAKSLLDIKAVFLRPNEPFTWASGIKSPIYCDNRFILSFPEKREIVVNAFVEMIEREYPTCEMLMGTATAGIPWAALIAAKMNLPMGYVRSSSKNHGKENKIEGKVTKDCKVVVVEDLISTGGSSKGVVEALRDANMEVLGVAAIFTYLLPAADAMYASIQCDFKTLSNYDVLVDIALAHDYIKENDLAKLKAWKKDPNDESWIHQ
ncbi:MAG: orotate phosphoribosyltransferase [Erysipelotrichaceae bacterium]